MQKVGGVPKVVDILSAVISPRLLLNSVAALPLVRKQVARGKPVTCMKTPNEKLTNQKKINVEVTIMLIITDKEWGACTVPVSPGLVVANGRGPPAAVS